MVTIQPASVDDPSAHGLLAEYFRSREIGFAHQNTVYTAVFPDPATFTPPAGVFLIVQDDAGAGVGCGGIRRLADSDAGIRYEVKHLYLRPETRGRGWGRLLLDDLERHAREWGAADIVLDTHHSLEAAAGLYTSAGFLPIERFNTNPNATRWYGKSLVG